MILPLETLELGPEKSIEWYTQTNVLGLITRLCVSPEVAKNCKIEDFRIGMNSYIATYGPFPAFHFMEGLDIPEPLKLNLGILYPGINLIIRIQNPTKEKIELSGFWELDTQHEKVQKHLDKLADSRITPFEKRNQDIQERMAIALEALSKIQVIEVKRA